MQKDPQPPVKVALIMIVKATDDEAEHLERCLASVHLHVDDIFLNLNHKDGSTPSQKVIEVATKYSNNIIHTIWENNFAKARNEVLDLVPAEFTHIIWLDTDDTVDKPVKIKEVAAASPYDSIFVDYLYDQDEAGNPLTVHMVARLFKNNGAHRWKNRIHETLVEQRQVTNGATKEFMVIHHADEDRKDASLERNIELLEQQIKDEHDAKEPDPRTVYYLASTLVDAGRADEAIELFHTYLQLSGWDQERSAAYTKLGRVYLAKGDRAAARSQFAQAIAEDVENPDPRVELASLELEAHNLHKARHWLEGVTKMEVGMSTLERNPANYTFRTYLLLANTYLDLGGKWLPKAAKFAKKARACKPKDAKIKEYTEMIEQVNRDREELGQLVARYKKTKGKDPIKAANILKSVPPRLSDNPVIAALRNQESFKWPQKSIAIMTGDTALDAWGPWSLQEGIGGSEEAIIRLSKHLAELGYKVVVYGKPGNNIGLDENGVMWRNYWDCNLNDEFDIFVAWRAPFIFEREIKARKSYLWLHDVMEPGEFTETRINNFDKCIVLSKYHRSLFPMIPDEKILMSGNGIDPEEFEPGDTVRDPHKILYASSHVRGLSYLYDIWDDVKKAVPDATLDVYYGRESYDAVHRGNPERMKWMDDMQAKARALEGVTDHGKASQEEIVRAGFRSGIWAYPCPFPEIYCITAIKSQASGAVPVASNYAALDETVQFGHKQTFGEFDATDLEKYKTALIDWLTHPEKQEAIRPEMMAWARTISWANVAKGWDADFTAD